MTTSPLLDSHAILANANAIQPVLFEEIEEAERRRQLTPRIVEALRSAGVFRMPMPAAWGGPEVDILSQIEIVEAVSRGYASAGWCAMIGSDGGFFSASLEDHVGRRLFADLDAVTAGMLQPRGRLDMVDDGFLLSGHLVVW
jgi:alkylation response protein AidB-like acyl-CoA dehydrogenase